jgi:hypothetical protein
MKFGFGLVDENFFRRAADSGLLSSSRKLPCAVVVHNREAGSNSDEGALGVCQLLVPRADLPRSSIKTIVCGLAAVIDGRRIETPTYCTTRNSGRAPATIMQAPSCAMTATPSLASAISRATKSQRLRQLLRHPKRKRRRLGKVGNPSSQSVSSGARSRPSEQGWPPGPSVRPLPPRLAPRFPDVAKQPEDSPTPTQ